VTDNRDTSRRVIDLATGVLVALRGCSEREAFEELAAAVQRTGVGIGSLAAALVALAGGRPGPVPNTSQALDVWGDLLAAGVYRHGSELGALTAAHGAGASPGLNSTAPRAISAAPIAADR
jgi:hypothetical protein